MKTLTGRIARLAGLTVGLVGLLVAVTATPGAATPSVGFSSQPLGRGTLASQGSLPLRQGMDIVAVMVTLNAGGSSGWHSHPGGGISIVVKGEVTVYTPEGEATAYAPGRSNDGQGDDGCVITRYTQGQAFIERPGQVVDAVNTGATDTIIVVTFPSVPAGGASRIDRPNPGTCGI
jgi:quercetin dioxygenase-like cupin family protein